MSSIYTLTSDVQALLQTKGWFTDALAQEFAHSLAKRLQIQFSEERIPRLRLSAMGPRCPKALWSSIHTPELAEALPPWVENKYAFGHMIEAWAITLAKAAGHEVTGEQDELRLCGIVGHRDCVIDGCIVDVKSTSSRSFSKFKDRSLATNDLFGYLDQLDGYVVASAMDPLVRVKDRGYLWAIDKQLGHMVLYEHEVRPDSIRERIETYKRVVENSEAPKCTCKTIPQGASGNIQLDVKASYSPWKYCCFPHLRTFAYANGPVYLTKVVRLPDVREITRYQRQPLER